MKKKNSKNPFCGLEALVELLCQVSGLRLLKQALQPEACHSSQPPRWFKSTEGKNIGFTNLKNRRP